MGILDAMRARLSRSSAAATPATATGSGAWYPIVHEPYPGAWQNNDALVLDSPLSNPTVFRCCSLIGGDIGKTPLNLVALDDDGIWTETTSPAFSPVLTKPNRYQTIGQFLEQWMFSKLLYGNTYVLKDRDLRGVVVALYVLDPRMVKPLVAPDGAVFYQLSPNLLAGLPNGELGVPAREMIHDRWNCAYHPLVGISPLYACGAQANLANLIGNSQINFFTAGGRPSGLLVAPTEIDEKTAARLSATWHGLGPGKTAVVGYGMKYQDIGTSAVDSQLTTQSDQATAMIAGCFGVPISYVDSSKQPPYANSEATQLQYQSQCLQVHMTALECALDEGLELPAPYGTEFDIDALIWMDTATRTKAAHDTIMAGVLSPNEARLKYFGLGPVDGGETPYLQQQMYSLAALAGRDPAAPNAMSAPAAPAPSPEPAASPDPTEQQVAAAIGELAKA
jgi:HK97 family phage portal protein